MNNQEGLSSARRPEAFTYADGPFPMIQDNGAPKGVSIGFHELPWGDNYVSDIFYSSEHNFPQPFAITAGAGDFLVGEIHENYIGDQNGNLIEEWLVFFYYLPWGKDGLDNDGDGCIDERAMLPPWPPCDNIPDAMVIYETGGSPSLGGDDGSLLINLDWYSGVEGIEIYRAFVSPEWKALRFRGMMYYPQIAGEFISYYAYEGVNGVNANPEMDSDQRDWYVGNIDARGFPGRSPVNHACAAGFQFYSGVTYKRDDGWIVTSFNLVEFYDNHDWNGDGDTVDHVAAYYAIDKVTGDCRRNAVNTGVAGFNPKNAGTVLTPSYTYDNRDGRDWDQDGFMYECMQLWHDVNSSWNMKGPVYTSYTFTATVPAWGFGWWGVYNDERLTEAFPLEFGAGFQEYLGYPYYYETRFVLTSDEDGDRHTMLPQYRASYGQPIGVAGGRCVVMFAREYYLAYAGIQLMPYPPYGDGNGDRDSSDTLGYVFCPDEIGGAANFIVEPTSKYAKGLYRDPYPFIWLGYITYHGALEIDGSTTIVFYRSEYDLDDDCDGNLGIGFTYCYVFYQISVQKGGRVGEEKMPYSGMEDQPKAMSNEFITRESGHMVSSFSGSTKLQLS
ncbi:MAG: hypothetical protein JSV43_06290 [Methanobacteriota archaeon]|nr:MAG: hypothetical protein JSV43_06290 [Euryarchaeota archaeon]